jgi:hypothetical protein
MVEFSIVDVGSTQYAQDQQLAEQVDRKRHHQLATPGCHRCPRWWNSDPGGGERGDEGEQGTRSTAHAQLPNWWGRLPIRFA